MLNKPLFAYERGNRFREISRFPSNLCLVIINPGIHGDTAAAYAGVSPRKPSRSLEELIHLPATEWKDVIRNDFEPVITQRHPVIAEIRDKLYRLGAVYASMSGSGSSVFGLFSEKTPEPDKHFPGFLPGKGHYKSFTQIQSSLYLWEYCLLPLPVPILFFLPWVKKWYSSFSWPPVRATYQLLYQVAFLYQDLSDGTRNKRNYLFFIGFVPFLPVYILLAVRSIIGIPLNYNLF